MEQPLVSVIITSYNREFFLKETIESILVQTYRNIEVIVVDDCSDFDFLAFSKQFSDNRLQFYQNSTGKAVAVNRNFGLRQAQGEYIAFCDDDDLWLPEKLEKQIKILEEKPEILLVGTNASLFPIILPNTLGMLQDKIIDFKSTFNAPFSLLDRTYVINSTVLFRKSIVKQIGFLDENKLLLSVEDFDYWLRILHYQDCSIYVLKEDLIRFRFHNANITKFDVQTLTKFDRLIPIYEKYIYAKHSVTKLKYRSMVFKIQNQYYRKNIKWYEVLFDSTISFYSRIVILLKKIYINFKNTINI